VAAASDKIVGFGAGLVRDDWWYLAALFVAPEVQGRGVGDAPRARRGRLSVRPRRHDRHSVQPVSNTLYAHHGLIPWLPILGLAGKPSRATRPSLPKGCDLIPLDASLLGEIRTIDGGVTGLDRTPDHAYLLSAEGGRKGGSSAARVVPKGMSTSTNGASSALRRARVAAT